MIIGRELIESQKLYSTGDDYLDELLERAFSEGYEYAQREFSDNVELAKEDKKAIKHWERRGDLANTKLKAIEGDKDAQKKLIRNAYKSGILAEGTIGAIGGGLIGAIKGKDKKDALRKAAIGAGIGAAAGTGVGALVGKDIQDSWKHEKMYRTRNVQYKKNRELEHDRLAVATGKMSKKDFVKKWGN